MWVFDEDIGMQLRDISYVPGLYKIFDEVLVNAADNKQRDKNMTCIRIDIDSYVFLQFILFITIVFKLILN
jgi:DNA topoisomerase-2